MAYLPVSKFRMSTTFDCFVVYDANLSHLGLAFLPEGVTLEDDEVGILDNYIKERDVVSSSNQLIGRVYSCPYSTSGTKVRIWVG